MFVGAEAGSFFMFVMMIFMCLAVAQGQQKHGYGEQ